MESGLERSVKRKIDFLLNIGSSPIPPKERIRF